MDRRRSRSQCGLASSRLNWPEIHLVEYVVLTQLQADALVTLDDELATAARAFVKTASSDGGAIDGLIRRFHRSQHVVEELAQAVQRELDR